MYIDEDFAEIADLDDCEALQAMRQHLHEIEHGTFFSFRAECRHDVSEFEWRCRAVGLEPIFTIYKVKDYPDVNVEMQTVAPSEKLKGIMRKIADSHVMIETLRECRLVENSLERDYECSVDAVAKPAIG
jgi:hypothetical protein